jgi:hypothetical protein
MGKVPVAGSGQNSCANLCYRCAHAARCAHHAYLRINKLRVINIAKCSNPTLSAITFVIWYLRVGDTYTDTRIREDHRWPTGK